MRFKTLELTLAGATAELRMTGSADVPLAELERATAAVADAAEDGEVRCLLLTSSDSWPGVEAIGSAERNELPFRFLELLRMPVIAVIEGACEGTALELALACDLRVASSVATFAMRQVTLGQLPSLGGTQRLPRLVGRTLASEMILLGTTVSAERALAAGLLNALTAPGEALGVARRLAERIRERGPLAVGYAKEAVLRGLDLPLDAALRYETDLTVILQTTADRNEGVRAFIEKREPEFQGE